MTKLNKTGKRSTRSRAVKLSNLLERLLMTFGSKKLNLGSRCLQIKANRRSMDPK